MAERWTELRVTVPSGWQELVGDTLAQFSGGSVAFGRSSLAAKAPPTGMEVVRAFVANAPDLKDLEVQARRALGELAANVGEPELEDLELLVKPLPAEDWAESWRKSWRPFRVGRLALVTPEWNGPLRPSDLRLQLQPSGSFGTGRHPTTRECLRILGEIDLRGARVLDAGSGTGLLGVAACMLGASSALGFDIDERSPEAGRDLAAANGVADRCEFRRGDFSVLDDQVEPFDVVLANIYSDVLQVHAFDLAQRLSPSGCAVFSGCPERHRDRVQRALEAAGLDVHEVRQRGRWRTFLAHPATRA
jgi:ribosomal protein L11 methyltransferase